MSQPVKPQENPKKKPDYTKKGLVISTLIAIAGIGSSFTVPEVRCFVGLKSDSCTVQQQEIQFITQAETGETLPGVEIKYISQGAPEVQYTDNNGFARVKVPSKGDVKLILSKKGYPTQEFTVDLQNDQSITRTVRLKQSGQPEITPLSPGNLPTTTATPTLPNSSTPITTLNQPDSTSTSSNQPIGSSDPDNTTKNFETLKKTKRCPKCYLVGIDMRGIILSDVDLRGANLRGVSANSAMNGANLSGADLRGFNGSYVNLQGANLQGANLEGANLKSANLRGADLSNVDLSKTDLTNADLSGAILPKGFQPPQ
ncbi:pentapeptide repeat-containing protein [Stenomitos frigidus]|nr:pentapeptide repeat-containing protein [Stenomitos frigidus]